MERFPSTSPLEDELRARLAAFRAAPFPVGRARDVPESGSFFTWDGLRDVPILVTRGAWGEIHALVNRCRHRDVRLVSEARGASRERFVCSQHGWTYDLCGRMTTLALSRCDADARRDESALVALPCETRHGFVWVVPSPRAAIDVASFLGEQDAALARLELDGLAVTSRRTEVVQASFDAAMTTHAARPDATVLAIAPGSLFVPQGDTVTLVTLVPRTPETTWIEHTVLGS